MRSTDLVAKERAKSNKICWGPLAILALTHRLIHTDHVCIPITDLDAQLLHLLITKAFSLSLCLYAFGEIPASNYLPKKEKAE